DAGAAQTITYMAGYATIGNNQLEFCIQDGTGIAAGGSMYRTFYPKQMFGEDTVISCYGVYSGLANSNDIFATLHGILIPRGNFAI
ncbi:MAG: hypothetical protein KGJ95_10545, partial [Candidatus Omnitrophica bacterium]|nr:hypothetical protein [Candidatus Omnitrophota bacterium]